MYKFFVFFSTDIKILTTDLLKILPITCCRKLWEKIPATDCRTKFFIPRPALPS